jgi:hypothetical protein
MVGQGDECRHRGRLEVNGAVKFQGLLAVSDKIAENPIPVRSDVVILDVGSRMRVRQGNSSSAGIGLFQTAANADAAFFPNVR